MEINMKCSEILEEWFNGANIQGVGHMETIELEEMVEDMKTIEKKQEIALGAKQARIDALMLEYCPTSEQILEWERNQVVSPRAPDLLDLIFSSLEK